MRKERMMLKVSSLVQNNGQLGWLPKNPRQWTQTDIDRTAASIREDEDFLEDRPLLVVPKDAKTWVVFAGNLRLTAAKKIGLKEVPCIAYARETDEDDTTIKRRAMKDNGSFGAWDYDALANEWDDLPLQDWGVPAWETQEPEPAATEVKEDDFNEDAEVETRCNPGDIWQLGEHRLMCGDSTDAGNVALLMDGAKADMVFTDPPYGMDLDTDYSSMQNHLDFAREKGFKGGKKYEAGYVDEFHPDMVQAVLNIGANETFLWGADYYADLLPKRNDGSWIVWDKRSNNTDDIGADELSDKMYGSCFELCWSKRKHKRDIARVKWAGVFGTEQEFDHKRHHPTQKPVKLSGWFIGRFSKEGDKIVDLFGGSGTTLIAAEQLGRRCYMMELDPHYCDVIIARWEKLTGQKAVRL